MMHFENSFQSRDITGDAQELDSTDNMSQIPMREQIDRVEENVFLPSVIFIMLMLVQAASV